MYNDNDAAAADDDNDNYDDDVIDDDDDPLVTFLQVIVNLYSVLHDPEVFPEPDILKPERFLDDEGKQTRPEQWIPFSMGES